VAYNAGNEISLNSVDNNLQGVVIQNNQEALIPELSLDSNDLPTSFGLAVSGFSNNPNSPYRHAVSLLAENFLYIRGSGTLDENPAQLILGVSGAPFRSDVAAIRSIGQMDIVSSSGMNIDSGDSLTVFNRDGQMRIVAINGNMDFVTSNGMMGFNSTGGRTATIAGTDSLVALNKTEQVNATKSSIVVGTQSYFGFADILWESLLNANISIIGSGTSSDILIDAGRNLRLQSDNNGGVLTYIDDDFKSWNLKTPYTDEQFFPIAHSGQVSEMIETERDLTFSWWVDLSAERVFNNNSSTFSVPAPTVRNNSDPSGVVAGFIMDVGQIDRLQVQFPCPHELDVSQPVSGMMYFRRASSSSDNTTAELIWTLRVNNPNDDFTDTAEGTNIFSVTQLDIPNGNSDVLLIGEIGTLFPGGTLTQDSFVHGSVLRDTAGNPNDTHTADVDLIGIKFVGKRRP
jgi:hypothetical protein